MRQHLNPARHTTRFRMVQHTSPLDATRGQALLPLGYALFGVIPLVLGAALITVGMVTGKRHHRRWQCTTGHKVIPRGFRLGGMVYRYQAPDGRRFEGQSQVATTPFNEGRPVPVLYDPQNPSYSVVDSVLHRGLLFVIAGAAFVVLGVGTVALLLLAALPAPWPPAEWPTQTTHHRHRPVQASVPAVTRRS